MEIKIFTNDVPGGWEPEDLHTGMGGSEESVVLLSEALVRAGYNVTVYHEKREPILLEKKVNGVTYLTRQMAGCDDTDIFISFKDNTPWLNGAKAYKSIHWTTEVERPWNTSALDHYVNISEFHKARNVWVHPDINTSLPLGVDLEHLKKHSEKKIPNTMLYCDSPDRGLEPLLYFWPMIKKHFPELKLRLTYGFNMFDEVNDGNPKGEQYKARLLEMSKDKNITMLGRIDRDEMAKEYWRAEYWALPLIVPDSQLNSLNAQKACFAGCIPVLNYLAALPELVGEHISFKDFIAGDLKLTNKGKPDTEPISWDDIVNKHWLKMLDIKLPMKKKGAA